jgi:hypothetical protein
VRIPISLTAVVIAAAFLGVSPSWAQGNTSGATIIATPVPVPAHPSPGTPPYMEAWAGLGATHSFFGGWVGGVAALSPHRNVWETGFVIRGEAAIGQYDAGTNIDDVLFHGASLMLGYRQVIGDGLLTGYVGANYETHDSDDRFATIRGTEAGVRALVEYYTRIMPSWDFYGQASYSTAFDTTFLFARSGVQLANTIWAGPETAYFQNESDYRENRLGGFVRFEQGFFGNGITLSGGWVNALRSRDEDGWYATLSIDFQFR